jgi:hypothetical protein
LDNLKKSLQIIDKKRGERERDREREKGREREREGGRKRERGRKCSGDTKRQTRYKILTEEKIYKKK